MPTYLYKCTECDYRFEKVQKITAEAKAQCPQCNGENCKRQVVATSFHLKGGGWYATDYGKKK
jgi:putative FmdB family regulatory protein